MENTQKSLTEIAPRFKTTPYKHQLECLNKFGRKEYFALLAEMGTGKTWIVINNMADLWSSEDCDAVLVFAPNGVHSNWTRLELPKHMPDWVRYRAVAWNPDAGKKEKAEMERLFEPAEGELRILTMNWEALQNKRGVAAAERFCNCSGKLMIVCDESDATKNPQAARTKALMKLKKFSHYRRIMTGTPINNAPFDAFTQFSFLDENILETDSYFAFKAEYAELLNENHHLIKHIVSNKTKMDPFVAKALDAEVRVLFAMLQKNGRAELVDAAGVVLNAHDAGDHEDVLRALETMRGLFFPEPSKGKADATRLIVSIEQRIAAHLRKVSAAYHPRRLPQIVDKDKATGRPKYRNLEKLSRLIAPHSFRVLKSDCLDLPDKIYKTVSFEMTTEQETIYKKAKEECRLVFEGTETPFTKLVAVQKLAQITSGYYIHPLSEEPVRIPGTNVKLELLAERVQAVVDAGEKVIVWARYHIEIEDITARLRADGHKVVQYFGPVKKTDREDAIDQFSNGDATVFVGSQAAGGIGITLVSASYVIYFSNDFSLRNRLQSEDRAHRIGQTKNVTYINIAAQDTIDEQVIDALVNKKDVADAIIDRGLALFST